MRIVIATPLYPPDIGGPATYAHLLASGLPQRGISVEVVKFAEVRHLPKVVRHIAYARLVYKAARAADTVLALDPVSTGLPALIAARFARRPFLVKVVGDYAWEQGRQRFGVTDMLDTFVERNRVPLAVAALRAVETFVTKSATRVIVPSHYLAGIVRCWGVNMKKVLVIPNSIEIAELGEVPAAVAALRRPLVVSVGRLVPWKRMEGVIDAVAATDAALAIVGEGPLVKDLQRQAAERLGARAVLTGALSHRDTLATIASADVFILNSTYEGLSHLLIEALAVGVPIIATDAGGNPEVIIHQKTGLVIPTGTPAALTTTLRELLGDFGLRTRLAAAAKAEAVRFSPDAMLDATAHVLTSLNSTPART